MSEHFMAVFGPYSQRVGEILDRYDPAVLAAAALQVGDSDDEIPLRPEDGDVGSSATAIRPPSPHRGIIDLTA
jgi:hypothetical protein